MISAGNLGWEVAPIPQQDWDGLDSYLPALKEAVARQSIFRIGRPQGVSEVRSEAPEPSELHRNLGSAAQPEGKVAPG